MREDTHRSLACLSAWMGALTTGSDGVWVEKKEFALTVHHRELPPSELSRTRRIVDHIVEPFADTFRVETGKNIWEIIPRELGNKGSAVAHQLAGLPGGTLPVYLGDDQNDEAAFAALPRGITVRVGDGRPTHAQYHLAGIPQVRTFLQRLKTEFV